MATQQTARHRLMTESYEDVERLIWDCVHKFHRKYGDLYGTREELFSEGCVGFVLAHQRYNPSKGAFSTYVHHMVGYKLLELVRTSSKHHARFEASVEVEPSVEPHKFSLAELLDELSEDAKTLVMLVLDTPNDLLHIMQQDESTSPKRLLRQYLSGTGWEKERISNCYSELEAALS